MDIAGNRKAVVIHVPYRLRKAYKKIHVRLVRELEKKFSGKVRQAPQVSSKILHLSLFTICNSLYNLFYNI